MVEELQLLIPLLQSAGEGAFWLIFVYLIVGLLKVVIPSIAILLVAFMIIRVVVGKNTLDQEIDARLSILKAYGYYTEAYGTSVNMRERSELMKVLSQTPLK